MEMTREEFEKLYRTMKNEDLAKRLGISKVTLIKYIKDAGIKGKGKGGGFGNKKLIIKG